MPKTIVVEITDEGEIRIETKGFTAKVCIEESQFIKDLIGEEIPAGQAGDQPLTEDHENTAAPFSVSTSPSPSARRV